MSTLRNITLIAASFNAVYGATDESSPFPLTWDEFEKHDNNSMDHLFNRYKKAFNKEFSSEAEEKRRYSVFSDKVKSFFEFNKKENNTYRKGITKFTDMDKESRSKMVMPETKVVPKTGDFPKSSLGKGKPVSKPLVGTENKVTCDMRPFTTSVKNQASCGSW